MSRESLKLYLPCMIFSVRVVLGPSENLTKLEKLVLRAVREGADTVDVLEKLFAIGSRPTLRLVLGLFDRGQLSVDLERGTIRLGPQVVDAIADNKLEKLSSTDTHSDSLQLMYDLVAGTVFRCRSRARRVRSGYTLSPLLSKDSFRKVDKARLLRVAGEIVRKRTTRAGRGLKVLELGLDLPQTPSDASSGEHRVIEIEVRVQQDEASDYVKITILYPDDLGSLTQRRLEEELTRLVNLPEPPLALKNLRDRPESVRLESSVDLKRRAEDLCMLVSRLEGADPGTFDEWQSSLASHAGALETALSEHRSCGLEHDVVTDQQKQVDRINDVIGRSRRQVVLACPFLHYDPTMQYREAIERAARRGVRIFLLWGVGPAARRLALDPGLTNWFDGLRERHPDRFYWSLREANVHAKFVVGDASELFVTSYNFMNKRPDEVFELGVWVGTSGTGDKKRRSEADLPVICAPALNALKIAWEKFSAAYDRQRMLVDAVKYGGREPAADGEEVWPTRSAVQGAGDETRRQTDRLWRKRWQDYAERTSVTVRGLGTTFEVVRDARHRELLYDALRTARHRVVGFSDRLSSAVVNRRFLDELNACLQRGARVVLLCQRPEASSLRQLRELERTSGDALQVLVAGGREADDEVGGKNHAKFLVADDTAVVTSFNFLSFAADDAGPDRHRLSTEVGLALRGGRAADQVLEAVRRRWPAIPLVDRIPGEDAEPREPVAAIPGAAPTTRDVGRLLGEIAAALRETAGSKGNQDEAQLRAERLREWFAGAPSWQAALSETEDFRVAAPPFMDQVIACFLDAWAKYIPRESAAEWIRNLIESLWWEKEKHDAMGVLVLLSLLGSNELSPAIPPPEIAELTAQHDLLGTTSARFSDVALEIEVTPNPAARQAVAALAIPQVVFLDDGPVEALELLTQKLQDGLAGWAQAAIGFREVHPAASREHFQALVDVEATRTRCDELHDALCSGLEKACALNLNFMVFKLTWPQLRSGEMGLDRLLKAAREEDVAHVAAFVDECRKQYGKGRRAAGKMLDAAVAEGAAKIAAQYRRIEGKFRGVCLDHLNDVLRLTQEWVQAARTVKEKSAVIDSEALRALVLSIVEQKPAVEEQHRAAEESRSFEGPLLGRMIRELEPVWQLEGKLK